MSSRGIAPSTETEPHIQCIKHRVERRIPKHDQIHRSLKFTFDSGEFVCDPSDLAPRGVEQGFDGSAGGSMQGEA